MQEMNPYRISVRLMYDLQRSVRSFSSYDKKQDEFSQMSEFLKFCFTYQFVPIIEILMDIEVYLGKKIIIHVSHLIEWRAKFGRIFALVVTTLTEPLLGGRHS